MSQWLGDFEEDSTLHFIWSSNDALGASITRATDGTISVYKDNGTTQSVAGVTDTEDFDSLTGLHACTIDLSADAFYDIGANYTVVLSAATIDGQTVNAVLANFSIENRGVAGAKAVWDRALTGSTHNIATSAGRRLRTLQDFGLYEGGQVWIDTVNGTAGTTDFENGTITNPVLTLADALTLSASLNINSFRIVTGSTITLASDTLAKVFKGDRWTLALGGQNVGGSHFEGASVSGIGTGTEAHYADCTMNACTLSNSHLTHCALANTITISATGDYFIVDCHSAIAGTSAPTIDMGAAVLDTNLNIRSYSGGIEIENLGAAGTDTMSMEGDGQIIFNANCVSGTAALRGNLELTNNGSGITITDEPRYDRDTHIDDNWDEVLTAHNITNSSGKILRELKELPGYEAGFIYIDTVNGAAGSEAFVNGVLDNPVDNIADANTIAAALNTRSFKIISGSSITFAASQENQEFVGESWTLALGGQSISGTSIHGADISGIGTGALSPHFTHCELDGATLPPCSAFASSFTGDMVLGSIGSYFFHNCYSAVAGTGTPSIDFGAALGNNDVNLRQYSGGIEIKNMGQTGTDNASIEGNGQVVTNANCAGGTIAIRGNFTTTDNSGGAVTFSDDARFDIAQSVKNITGRIPATLVSGLMDSNISAVNGDSDAAVRMALAQIGLEPGAAATGTLSVTEMTTNLTEVTDDHYNGRVIVWTSGVLARQATNVTDYDGATKKLTYTTTTEPPADGDTFVLY